jgi:hypothetical protein
LESNHPSSRENSPNSANTSTPSRKKSFISLLKPFSKILCPKSNPTSASSSIGELDYEANNDIMSGKGGDELGSDAPSSASKSIFANLQLFGAGDSISEPSYDQRPSTISRVLSTTNPIFAWIKGGARPERADVVNPMLHLATFAMNAEEQEDFSRNESIDQSSIHNVLPTGQQEAQNFWHQVGVESSGNSSDSGEDDPQTKSSRIVFSESMENVSEKPSDVEQKRREVVFSDTKQLSAAEKLQIVFELPSVDKYYKEFACWLVRSVLLKGHLYVTERHSNSLHINVSSVLL